MPLPPGSSLAHYSIVGPLGAGAMGEVYRARDTKLGREVAIKVLPEHFADDAERLRRFEREAKTLAALNHPNVAQIFGVDQQGDTCFLVLELVPGETLEDRLKQGPLPVAEAIDVCRQIAEGLEAAHESGVIHRDLKPANVRMTPDGKVKVLDFGLAKPAREAHEGSSTDSVLSTEQGRLLGTPTYMAPEQARGKPIDRRVDVWAFGCVLYECLTAKRAFAGETLTDVLGAVLHAEPDLGRLRADVPRSVRSLLERCFAKDARQRLRDLGDARIELERAMRGERETVAAGARGSRSVVLLVVLVLAAAALAFWLGRASEARPPRESTQLELSLAPAESLGMSSDSRPFRPSFALTSDGRRIVFIGQTSPPEASDGGAPLFASGASDSSGASPSSGAGGPSANPGDAASAPPPTPVAASAPSPTLSTQLYVRSLDAGRAVPLAGTEGADTVFLSPDDRFAGFLADGEIRKVPLAGGPVARIAKLEDGGLPSASPLVPANRDLFGACFDADGSVLFGRFRDGLWEVAAGGGAPKRLTTPKPGDHHRLPRILPDRRGILFTRGNHRHPQVCVVARDGGEAKVLVEEATDGRFVAPDRLLYASDGALLAAPFDLERLAVSGPPVVLVSNLLHAYDGQRPAGAVLTAFFEVSASGTLVFAEGGRIPVPPSRLVWVSRDGGKVEPIDAPVGYHSRPRLSPDGGRICVTYAATGKLMRESRPHVIDLDRGTFARVIDEEGWWSPHWSSDGTTLFAGTSMQQTGSIGAFAADGSSTVAERLAGGRDGMASCASSDGQWILFVSSSEAAGTDIFKKRLGSDAPAEPVVATRANEAWPELSPDGQFLAYGSDSSGRMEVYVQPFPGPGPRVRVSVDSGNSPLWSRDGRELFFTKGTRGARGSNDWYAVDVTRDPARPPGISFGKPRLLFSGTYQRLGGLTAFDITPDGKRFVLVEQTEVPDRPTTHLRVVLDWLPEMRPIASSGG